MRCEGCGVEVAPADLHDGDLCRDCFTAVHLEALAEVGVNVNRLPVITTEPPAPLRRRAVLLETFEQRDERLAALPGGQKTTNPTRTAGEVSRRLDQADDRRVHSGVSEVRECPVCRRLFKGGRVDRITCPDGNHCRDLARRVRQKDPTVDAALVMLFDPPNCAGCGEPLWGKRPDARHHNQACVKRRQRREQRAADTGAG